MAAAAAAAAVRKGSLSSMSKLITQSKFESRRILSTKASPSFNSSSSSASSSPNGNNGRDVEVVEEEFQSSGISRPISQILKELNKKVPESLLKSRTDPASAFSIKYIPWHITNRIMNLHAPEWSGEVRNITYSADAKSVSVVYRVTIYGTDAEIFRESTGTAPVSGQTGYGDPVQIAEAMAFRRACARFGLGLHLYHEDME